jgi:hypothetical protein
MTLTSEQAQQAATAMTLGFGVGNTLVPRLMGDTFGLETEAAPLVPWVLRMYGISLVSLGTLMQVADDDSRKTVLEVAVVSSGSMAASSLIARARGQISTRSAIMTAAAAGAVCALALSALSDA